MKVKHLAYIALGLLLVGFIVWLFAPAAPSAKLPTPSHNNRKRDFIPSQALTNNLPKHLPPRVPLDDNWNAEDRKIANQIQAALDSEDLNQIKDLAELARKSKNAEIRKLMVEALQWFDTKAMLQLAPFLNDEDEEVSRSAANAWQIVLANILDEDVKAGLIVESLQIIRNEDDADMTASELHSVNKKLAIDSLAKLLGGTLTTTREVRKKLLETYEFITGEEYVSAARAREWLKENVDPDEDDE